MPDRVPFRLAVARWERRGARHWEDAEQREWARRAVRATVGEVDDLDRHARQVLIEREVRRGLMGRPRDGIGTLVGADHLRAARASGRGVIVSIVHLEPIPSISLALAGACDGIHYAAGKWMFHPLSDPTEERLRVEWLALAERHGARLLQAEGGSAEIERLLRAGEAVLIAFDVVGSRPTRFLGHDLELASGTQVLAQRTGALTVPVERMRRGHRVITRAYPPLEPTDDLHERLAAHHEATIRARPGAYENPVRPAWWGARFL